MKSPFLVAISLLAAFPATAQTFAVTGLNPARNAGAVPRAATVNVTFSQSVNNSPATLGALRLFSSQRGGRVAGTTTASGNTLAFDPARDLQPGETVQATLTAAAQSNTGTALAAPQVFQFTAAVQGGTGALGGGSEVGTGANPLSVVTADVDNDGDLDVLTSNIGRNTVSVRLNNGRGQFSGSLDVPVDIAPFWLAVGDIDADGDLDLLTANAGNTTVSVRLNDGTGTFAAGAPVAVQGISYHLSLADVDGDADLDLLVARTLGSSVGVSVRLNNGAGTFGNGADLAVGTAPWWVTAADLDADGDLDLLVANFDAQGTLNVRYNIGNGVFSGGYDLPLGTSLSSLAVADLDRDGDLDLLAVDNSSNRVRVRANNGAGMFVGNLDVPVGNSPRTVAPADLDGDGDLDLVVSNQGDFTLSVLLNNGAAGFTASQTVAVGREPLGVATADIDGDGDLDALAANVSSNSVSVRLNNGTGAPLAARPALQPAALVIYPNPARTEARLHVPRGAAAVMLRNVLGQLVREVNVAAGATTATVPVHGLAPGVYTVQAAGATGRLVVE